MFLFKAHLYTNLHTHHSKVSIAWMGEVPLAQELSAPRIIAEQRVSQMPHQDKLTEFYFNLFTQPPKVLKKKKDYTSPVH